MKVLRLGLRHSCAPAAAAPAFAVAADRERMGNHRRNCGFNFPAAVYMPVATRKRSASFRIWFQTRHSQED
jgi:hypothetical protein